MDIMVDLETMSPRSNAAIASIGAVAFDIGVIDSPQTIPEERRFYTVVDLGSQKGFNFDGSSIYWWLQQPKEARDALIPPNEPTEKISIRDALEAFTRWFRKMEGKCAYSYGSTFDLVIMQNAYTALRLRNPIHYREQLCARTIIGLSRVQKPQLGGIVPHRSLDDALIQVIWLQNAVHSLHTGR